jgi:large subunit ribosomal protein L31
MKKSIHPKYAVATYTCACGTVVTTRSVKAAVRLDVCSNCHPFYTQTQRFVDTAGRVEKFMNKYKKGAAKAAPAPEPAAAPAAS